MRLQTRKILDRAFAGSGMLAIALMAAALLILLMPMFIRGASAIFFTGTVEHRRLMLEKFERGNRAGVEAEIRAAQAAREPVYRMIADFEQQLSAGDSKRRVRYAKPLKEFKKALHILLGPAPGDPRPSELRPGRQEHFRNEIHRRDRCRRAPPANLHGDVPGPRGDVEDARFCAQVHRPHHRPPPDDVATQGEKVVEEIVAPRDAGKQAPHQRFVLAGGQAADGGIGGRGSSIVHRAAMLSRGPERVKPAGKDFLPAFGI